jgi:hypothetical protein
MVTVEVYAVILGGISGLVGGGLAGWLLQTRRPEADSPVITSGPRVSSSVSVDDQATGTAGDSSWSEGLTEEERIIARRLRLLNSLWSRGGQRP